MNDRDRLAKLVLAGKVWRRPGPAPTREAEFVADITRRVARLRPGADTIRPKKRRKR